MVVQSRLQQSAYLKATRGRVLVFDGAMGTCIQDCNPTAADFDGLEGCNEYLGLSRPALVESIHAAFLDAGCDVLETNTFGASRLKLREYGLENRTREINIEAAQLACRLADSFSSSDHPRFVAGAIGPTGMLPSTDDPVLGAIGFDELAAVYYEQVAALVDGGVDLIVFETTQDLLELKAGIAGAWRYFKEMGRWVPIQAQITLLETSATMLLGTDVGAALTTLEALPIDVIGMNCSTGPEMMREPARFLAERSSRPIAVIPNAGLPLNVAGRAVYPMLPDEMAGILAGFVDDYGINIVGGCCGSTPDHIRQLVDRVGRRAPRTRQSRNDPSVASSIRSVAVRQVPAPLLVGERVNATGSRHVKRLLLKDNYDAVLQVARDQVEGGAHALDVSVALTERSDEAEQMRALVRKLQMGVEAPLVIDSTEPDVLIAALHVYPGRPIINSVNLENRAQRLDRVMPAVVEHGAAVVGQTIDEHGMGKTASDKLRIAERLIEVLTQEYALDPESILIDTLVFPIVTGDPEYANAAVETLEAIRGIKESLPGVHTILGVSNLSFGITPPARAVLNSVFLHHAVEAGLDVAIVNPAHITPYAEIPADERDLADDLIFNRRTDALARYVEYFDQRVPTESGQTPETTESMTVEERIHYQILHRRKDGIEALLDAAIARHDPVWVLNQVLLPAMKDVGDRFGAGELILPFVLQSAEVMKRAVAHLEQFLEKRAGSVKGTVVLATVFGDVHDIGKNLVATILSNNGYAVHDLGKQVPLNRIIETALEVEADAIGLSALLVSTSKQMPLCVQELHRQNLAIPVLIGGAAINRSYGLRALFPEERVPYEAGVFYAKDAFEGLQILDRLSDPDARRRLTEQIIADGWEELRRSSDQAPPVDAGSERSPNVRLTERVPSPPFWGVRTLTEIPLADVFDCMDLNTLFRLHWGGKLHGDGYERLLLEDFQPRLARMQEQAIDQDELRPRAVYGFFPAASDGNTLILFDPNDPLRELARLTFPRQPSRDRLCLSDYFLPIDSGRLDVAALQLVTMGSRPTELVDDLQTRGDYADAYFLHGLAVEAAEGLAEYLQRWIRRELGIGADEGKRYSWGYPACPDLEQQEVVLELLQSHERIGVDLTPGYQLTPEQSTAALVVHHPQAKYFSTSVSEPVGARRT
jgi:5-methyltetrahydrofolate--homocysteine methyltransferase